MSVQATTWVWDHSKAENAGLLVMLAIADGANREGAASMQSVPTIAKMCRISERHVMRCIVKLIEMGELERTGRSQRYGTSVYRLARMGRDPDYGPEPTPDELSGGQDVRGDAGVTEPLTSDPSTPDPQVTQPQETYPNNNPTPSSVDDAPAESGASPDGDGVEAKSKGPTVEQLDAAFEKWWALYPRKVGKQAARKSFDKALKQTTYRKLGEGLEAAVHEWQVKETPKDKIPHPTTWLNEGRWDDEHEVTAAIAALDEGGLLNGDEAWMVRRPEGGDSHA